MEKLITPADVMERYGCSRQTARKYIRQCNPYMEKPLATFEWAFKEWEMSRLAAIKTTTMITPERIIMKSERVIVPRRR